MIIYVLDVGFVLRYVLLMLLRKLVIRMNKITNITIVGVGGQGVLLASEIISLAALKDGYDVKKSEVHGMAQRGGSVVTNVRFGDKIYSPIIADGEADILLAFEKLEALRWLSYLKEDGKVISSTQRIDPIPVGLGKEEYPEDIIEKINDKGFKVKSVKALELAREAGSQKIINTVLIGALSDMLDIERGYFQQSL